MNIISYKGGNCPCKPILCQEGYCQDCQIYWDKQMGKYDLATQKELADLKAMREASKIKQ